MNIKDTLEKKLGKLTDAEVNFGVQQFEKNAENIRLNRRYGTGRRMSNNETLNEIAISIEFYKNHYNKHVR